MTTQVITPQNSFKLHEQRWTVATSPFIGCITEDDFHDAKLA